ncbi:NADP-dependent oxidoreductase [Frankia sp. CNm7]|uniref:NADP-dependent oxidoreductase n=1 Tax=Frankia nepalensis TaxID=1836974 RepID=A0A937UWL6_9ACTN|nr:NADP-dependent oxidoreductase [Frankia nepalensis]MBL7500785.1 NADP-dependent oxidoreductase [Frankia nepalensis]MBL7512592.1 NADP-dependent oxidoreductase [Frankia nepalensis]MBL7519586.1 NADP-dependent oxidoreductase [Frankia nepalensis]MBL7633526.1 NADP-dependent oxidoreductase [Frankia nepalensis]
MRAAAFTEPGGPDVLRLMDLDTPHAGAGQVRVRIRAAGVQPVDCAVRAGRTPPWMAQDPPTIPGNEFAGVIDEVGQGVAAGLMVGGEVLGFGRLGAYAEYLVVPADQVTAKPAAMPWEVAGGFSGGAQTAHIALRELAVGKGDTLLIHGAAGAVGTVATQLAARWGATVIGTASAANHDYLRSLGALPVAYGDGLLARVRALAPDGVDAVLDGAGGDALTASLALVADRSRVLTLVEHAKAPGLGIRTTPNLRSSARLAELARLYADGQLHVQIRRVFPLGRAADAHRDVETGHGRGKVVLLVD